jgi:hypothetical protein
VAKSEELRALAARLRHLAENVVTNEEVAEALLQHAADLDGEADRSESAN